jgi:hypothetical protein
VVPLGGVEPSTVSLGPSCSVQLSYRGVEITFCIKTQLMLRVNVATPLLPARTGVLPIPIVRKRVVLL